MHIFCPATQGIHKYRNLKAELYCNYKKIKINFTSSKLSEIFFPSILSPCRLVRFSICFFLLDISLLAPISQDKAVFITNAFDLTSGSKKAYPRRFSLLEAFELSFWMMSRILYV
jgi:hypothetical protein